ncbi:MAG: hypothetical protein KIT31_17310 [Deltaproteobacteria bacterium]|nr:hypothetical protein [Deltaproteobacteria bacterium]
MRRFNPASERPARAVQCWQILVGAAMHRQTLSLRLLAQAMYGKPDPHPQLADVLAHVAWYCADEKLPPLAAVVVQPAKPVTDTQREAVYAYDWFDVYPPTADELARAFARPR